MSYAEARRLASFPYQPPTTQDRARLIEHVLGIYLRDLGIDCRDDADFLQGLNAHIDTLVAKRIRFGAWDLAGDQWSDLRYRYRPTPAAAGAGKSYGGGTVLLTLTDIVR